MPGLQTNTINIDIIKPGFKPKTRPYLHFGSAARFQTWLPKT